jgi:glycosyltransferase 2 family protein
LNKIKFTTLRFIIFLAIGIGLLWFIYKDKNFDEVRFILHSDFRYGWLIFAMVLELFSHYSRAIRWKLLIGSTGENPSTLNTFLAVMVGYISNLAVPRMGEIARCGVLSKHEGISFVKLAGTVVLERAVDMIMLLVFTLVSLVTQLGVFSRFFAAHPEVLNNIEKLYSNRLFYIGILFLFLAGSSIHLIVRKKSGYVKTTVIFKNFLQGILSIKHMEKKWGFIFHSILIWALYFLVTYVCFFAFNFTAHLGPFAGLFVFVLGSYGMLAPIQGGFGPWHFMTIAALMTYGVSETSAATFALVVHSAMTLLLIVGGVFAFIALPLVNRKKTVAFVRN